MERNRVRIEDYGFFNDYVHVSRVFDFAKANILAESNGDFTIRIYSGLAYYVVS